MLRNCNWLILDFIELIFLLNKRFDFWIMLAILGS